jgi:Ca2+-binding EF-hand superfamily protein
MEEVRQAFDLFDRDGDGVVTKAELIEIFDRLGGQVAYPRRNDAQHNDAQRYI